MKKLLCFSFIILGLISCSEDESICCTNISTDVYIQYLDENGENLLALEGDFDENSVSSYEKIDGEWEFMNNGQPGIVEVDSETYLKAFLSLAETEPGFSETKIQIEDKEYIFRSEITGLDSGGTVTTIWYDNALLWENDSNEGERFIEIQR